LRQARRSVGCHLSKQSEATKTGQVMIRGFGVTAK
jgi:hypothetical protein